MAQLFVTYVCGKTNKEEVLSLISKILNLSEEEKKEVSQKSREIIMDKIGLIPTRRRWSIIPFLGSTEQSNKPKEKVN